MARIKTYDQHSQSWVYADKSFGKDGDSVTVTKITESSADGGSNIVTFSDGKTLTVKNGTKGSGGATGPKGDKGDTGPKGVDGYSPIKGVDYFTAVEQESMIHQIALALATPVFGRVDENKNIIVTGNLDNGTYTLKYEDASGNTVSIGIIDIGGVAYTNQLPIAIDTSGNVYNEKGFKENTRLSGTGTDSESEGMVATGFIPFSNNAILRIKSNIAVTNDYSNQALCFYDANKTFINRLNWGALNTSTFLTINTDGSIAYTLNANYWSEMVGKTVAYVRATFPGINDSTIITVNEEII